MVGMSKKIGGLVEKIGATPVGSGSKDFEAFMRAEAAKWEPVLKAVNIRAQ
jgi:tripartite-type tricarboxylate transporter receptor subunit TctC